MSERRWYVVHTQPNGEGRADLNLCRQGFATYLPRYARRRRHARRQEVVKRPLFPRYLFVGLDLARDRLGLSAVAAGIDHDGRAILRQCQRNRASYIAPGAGDDGDLAGEFVAGHPHFLNSSSSARLLA